MASNVTFRGIDIGDYGSASFSYSRQPRVVNLPRADGVRIYNNGGGTQTIKVSSWTKKTTVKLAQDYIDSLQNSLTNTSGTLIINGISYTSTLLVDIDGGEEDSLYKTFTCTFIRSAF